MSCISWRIMQDTKEDYTLLSRWLSDERVLCYYEGRDCPFSYEMVEEKYSPRAQGRCGVTPCIIEEGGLPLGYAQYYLTDRDEYEVDERADMQGCSPIYGVDLFIGVPEKWGKGIGSEVLRQLLAFLFVQKGAAAVYIDPKTDNLRAIACYKKCGFEALYVHPNRELHEGRMRDNLIMRVTRKRYSSEPLKN